MITILSAIISGIVIDAFNAIRDKHSDIQEDMKNKCFICSLDNSVFDRHAEGFTKHIEVEHNMWHYLFFWLYLAIKEESEYNSQEAYISTMVKDRDMAFFPVSRAMCLESKGIDLKKEKD